MNSKVFPFLACVAIATSNTYAACASTSSAKLATQQLARLPIAFEPNVGQIDAPVDYVSHAGGCNLFLSPGSAVISLSKEALPEGTRKASFESVAVRMELLGAAKTHGAGAAVLPGTANYISGSNPKLWHTSIPTYGRVSYTGVYSGIDLTYYGNNSRLEYDFTVAPGSNPEQIALRFVGPRNQQVNSQGQLVLDVAHSPMVWDRPAAYQTINGVRSSVSSHYVLADGSVKIAVGAYDHSKPLVIDPVLVYGTYFPAASLNALAINAAGEVFVSGETSAFGFPTTLGALHTTGGGTYLSRVSAGGSAQLFATYLGFDANVTSIAVDSSNNSYIGGNISEADLTTTTNAFQSAPLSASTGFLVEIDGSGTTLNYGTYIGGTGTDTVSRVAANPANTVVVAGSTTSSDFPATSGAFQTIYSGAHSTCFVAKFATAATTSAVFASYLGGSNGTDAPTGLGIDPATGNAYVTGTAGSTDFPVTASALQKFSGPNANGFLTDLNASGTTLLYGTFIPGGVPAGLSFMSAANVYVGGKVSGTFTSLPGGEIGSLFVSDFDPTQSGSASLHFATAFGGNTLYTVTGYTADINGVSYFTGGASSTLALSSNALQPYNNTFTTTLQPFFIVLNSDGSLVTESTFFGGTDKIYPSSIAADGAGGIFIGGDTLAQDMPTSLGVLQVSPSSISNSFLDKFTLLTAPGPQINYFSPRSVVSTASGTVLTIVGAGFNASTTVKFGSAVASGVTHVSATKLTVPLTAAALALGSTVPVTVTNPGTPPSVFSLNLQVVGPNPTIASFSPNPILTSSTSKVVDILGVNFASGATVSINGIALTAINVTFVNPYDIKITIPASYLASPGNLTIVVTNPLPATVPSTGVLAVVAAPTPTLTSISPTSVVAGTTGVVLTLTGANFSDGASVIYNGVNGSPFPTTFVSSTSLTTIVPATAVSLAGSVTVQVTSPTGVGGGISSSQVLTVTPIIVTSFIVHPANVVGGTTTTGTITIATAAPNGGAVVTLSVPKAVQPYVSFPATVTVPAGATTLSFSTIKTNVVFSSYVTVAMTAAIGTSSQVATFYVSAANSEEYAGGVQFFSVPYSYSALLSSIFVSPPTSGQIANWNTPAIAYIFQGGSVASPTIVTMTPGTGYWGAFPSSGTNLLTLGTPASTTATTVINLFVGWNSIGDPYTTPVNVSDLTFNNGSLTFAQSSGAGFSLISPVLYGFTPNSSGTSGTYTPVVAGSSLAPGQGYWIYDFSPTTLSFTPPGLAASAVVVTGGSGTTGASGGTTSTGGTTTTGTIYKKRRHH